ncbi:MAG: serine/threonine-protein kinase, partial [Gemmatimonadales bacterium]
MERELATGGMGTVYLGRDTALDRPVAIKVLRPELATAAASERFLREARILASLDHPNVVTVHHAGETGGLSWYVMDFLAAETLATRLQRGPLPAAEAVAVALDVLAALEAAHRHGVVHRDVKPSNVFLGERHALLGDFGIASSSAPLAEPLTAPGRPLGTPDYMAPEQMVGKPATPATDICAVGLLLFEALTGTRFEAWDRPERADWSRVPRPLARAIRRALAFDPAARWRDAAAFQAALRRAEPRARVRRFLWGAAALCVAAAAVAWWLTVLPRARGAAGGLHVVVQPFRVSGAGAPAWLGDSLARTLVHAFGANTDFLVRLGGAGADTSGALVLEGQATVRGESLDVALTAARPTATVAAFRADTAGLLAGWEQAAADLAWQVLLRLWSDANAAAAADLPLAAAPRSEEGLRSFLRAEQLFAHAQWLAAYKAYSAAREIDPTCLICDVRIVDVSRWLGLEPDTARTRRYRAAIDSFPPHYRLLLRASFEPPADRMETLRDLTERYRGWGFGWFILGDEIFHRGPLVGFLRADALAPLEQAAVLRPDFAPVWEHLAWAAVAEGDSATAERALLRYAGLAGASDTAAGVIGALIHTGFVWRFARERDAAAFTTRLLRDPAIAAAFDLRAAASYMLTFEVPRATVWLGERFAAGVPRAGLEESGLLAQVYGLVALGHPDSALAVARRLGARTGEPAVALFTAELPAALALADSADVGTRWAALASPLESFASGSVRAAAPERARAAWMLGLLASRARRGADVERARLLLAAAEPPGSPLAALVAAEAGLAARGTPGVALRRTAALAALDSANRGGDPFYRALLHFERAAWQLAAGTPALAAAELRWHENNDFVGYPG